MEENSFLQSDPEEIKLDVQDEKVPAVAEDQLNEILVTPREEEVKEPELVQSETGKATPEEGSPELATVHVKTPKRTRKTKVSEEAKPLIELPLVEEEEEEEETLVEETPDDYSHFSREQLVEMLEKIVQEQDINLIKSQVAQIKVAYLSIAKEEHHEKLLKAGADETAETVDLLDPLEERFKAAFNIYRINKARFNENLEQEKLKNLEAKKHILEELKVLISSEETLKKTYDDFKLLQEQWKTIGIVPKSEVNSLWQNYHFLLEKFFDKVKINRELKDLDQKKNLERKIELCEKVEALLLETSITKAFKRLQETHDEWKEIGPVPQDKRDEIWDRFKTATEKINERRREFYGKIQEEQDANYAAKVVLCEKAEQIVSKEYNSIKEWQDSTAEVNELLKLWKTVGPASVKLNNEIWYKFKAQLDAYFTAKKEFFAELKDRQLHNYNLKVDLCVQAENLRLSSDWKSATKDLIRLQDEWKKIGPVPRKHSDKIWKRFRQACDEFFSRKSDYFKEVKSSESVNLKAKEELIKKLKEFTQTEDKQANLDFVKEIQRQWMETGHVPIKEKDRLQAEFKTAVNKIYDKLKVDAVEISTMNYKSKFENIKDQPDALRIINKERVNLQSKIDQLKDEILLWENNIGFFANSKQANVLKMEFEGKINRAKDDLAKLEAKMKFLRKAAREQENH
jgi:hypothetical protein